MSWKVWVISGILLMLAGFSGIFWLIYKTFYVLGTAQNAGIGEIGDAIKLALICSILGIVGIIPVTVGLVKLYKSTKSKS